METIKNLCQDSANLRLFLVFNIFACLLLQAYLLPAYLLPAETDIATRECVFETSFSALALKPLVNNTNFSADSSDESTIYNILPTYQFGFDLGITAYICPLDAKIRLNWERIHTSNKSLINPDSPENFTTLRFNFDEINLIYGQQLMYDNHLQGSLYYGISAAHIKALNNPTYSNITEADSLIASMSSFNGAGIQAGFDFSYDITSHFQLTGEGALSLLAGHLNYCALTPHLTDDDQDDTTTQATILNNYKTQFVPALRQNIGLAYFLPYGQSNHFKLEVGYQAQVYFNALQSPVAITTSDFALIGPYVSINLGF